MGSNSSKTHNQTSQEYESSYNNQSNSPSTKKQYQTSIYGWGRLKHPFKPGHNSNGNKQNGNPLVGNHKSKLKSKNQQHYRNSEALVRQNEFATEPKTTTTQNSSSSSSSERKKKITSVNIPVIQGKSTLTNGIITSNDYDDMNNGITTIQQQYPGSFSSNNYNNGNGTMITTEATTITSATIETHSSTTISNGGGVGGSNDGQKSTTLKRQVLSNPTFYGHYICSNCKRYWRSGKSKEGIPQDCSECGTPTVPRR